MENNLHSMELKERDLKNDIREKVALEERVGAMRQEIAAFNNRIKVSAEFSIQT